ncbi:enoyl-CoA hydratase-related protein [Desulfotignum balticum]|uniref:enoyl-CoA hydratase-related protein n=1 Tax=Desulfotignum balticum TaxID=115781 RepID=UPI0004059085|nr:enoyl-CoA hydratase-related protein [Desulfotignum balticum]
MPFKNIILNTEEKIATILFNRPNVLNALNSELFDELDLALDRISADKNIKVLILTDSGKKAFVAGADIIELSKMDLCQAKFFARKGQKIFSKLESLPIPVIAAVNGLALGGGFEAAMGCDFIYAASTAVFGLPESNLGLIPGFGGTQRLARLVGPNLSKELILTGISIPAEKALEYGIANLICDPENLMKTVMKTAVILAKKSRTASRAAKEAIQSGMNTDLESGFLIENEIFESVVTGGDAKEGIQAFFEKREPTFI